VEYDAEGRPVSREIYSLPDGNLDGLHEYTWEGDRLVATHNETLFTTWDETWTWNGNRAEVAQDFIGAPVVRQIREFVPSPLSWPILSPEQDLPNLAFTVIGSDENGNGTLEPNERIREQEVDENGIPSFARFYDATGALFSQVEWGDCPTPP
jgi:hypothetical protein